jgi:hypothetical protein
MTSRHTHTNFSNYDQLGLISMASCKRVLDMDCLVTSMLAGNASMAKRPANVEGANLTHVRVLGARTWRPASGGAMPAGCARAISKIGSQSVVSIF